MQTCGHDMYTRCTWSGTHARINPHLSWCCTHAGCPHDSVNAMRYKHALEKLSDDEIVSLWVRTTDAHTLNLVQQEITRRELAEGYPLIF